MILLLSPSSTESSATSLQKSPESRALLSNGMSIAALARHQCSHIRRDSEDSAPAQYPPEQPEADQLDDDEARYGAEEAEMQAALEKELEETEAKVKDETVGADADMGGTDAKKEDDSDAGSEDLEAESSSDDDDEEEEAEGDEDLEMADGDEKPVDAQANGDKKTANGKQPEVMVH